MEAHRSSVAVAVMVTIVVFLTACGGGGSSSSPVPSPSPTPLPPGPQETLVGTIIGYILNAYDPAKPDGGVGVTIPRTDDNLDIIVRTTVESPDSAELLVTIVDRRLSEAGARVLSESILNVREKKGEVRISHQGSKCVGGDDTARTCGVVIQNLSPVMIYSRPGWGAKVYSAPKL